MILYLASQNIFIYETLQDSSWGKATEKFNGFVNFAESIVLVAED